MALTRHQSKIAVASSGDTVAASFTSLPQVGSFIVALVAHWSQDATSAVVSDNQGNTWTKQIGLLSAFGAGSPGVQIWTAPANTSAGTFTVTAAGGLTSLIILEIRGALVSAPVNDTGSQAQISTTAPATTGLTTTLNNCLVIGVTTTTILDTVMTAAATWTQGEEEEDNNNFQQISEIYKAVAVAGAANPTWSLDGTDSAVSAAIAIAPALAPVADFSGNDVTGFLPHSVQFTDLSTNSPTTWDWDFGDGSGHATTQHPAHTYTSAGTYTVVLTASNSGGSDAETKTGYVTVTMAGTLEDGLIAFYTFNDTYADGTGLGPTLEPTGGTTFFTGLQAKAASSGGFQGSTSSAYIFKESEYFDFEGLTRTIFGWAWADSYAGAPGILSNWASGGGPAQWLFYHDGTNLVFQIRDSANADHLATYLGTPPEDQWFSYELSYNHVTGDLKLRINNGTAVTANTGSVKSGTTFFEVGSRNGASAPLAGGHDSIAIYDRILTDDERAELYNAGAGLDYPFVSPPVTDFSADDTTIDRGDTVTFTDLSTNTPTSWDWDFGDGSTHSTEQNPEHQYDVAGTYTVILIATNDDGSDTETKTNYIVVAPIVPVAAFSGTPLSGERGFVVVFTDASTGEPEDWDWNFGDGTPHSSEQSPSHAYGDGTFTVTLTVSNVDGSDSEIKTDYVTATAPTSFEDDEFSPPEFRNRS